MDARLEIRPQVSAALGAGRPVVALETAVVTHGLPPPRNLAAARRMEGVVREEGAVPATVGVVGGRAVVGLSDDELQRLSASRDAVKASTRDLAPAVAGGGLAGTTVAATVHLAGRSGIDVVATGGIGGVHRDAAARLDISADLTELARTPTAVVCAGAKAVLDLPRTLEALETAGVGVIGYETAELPAFWSRESGLSLPDRVDTPEEAAALIEAARGLGVPGGMVFAVPPPKAAALPREEVEGWVERALEEAAAEGVAGKAVTPYLLERVAALAGERALDANAALLERNAGVAARIAGALAARRRRSGV